MPRVRINVDLPDETYIAYEQEGRRTGMTVERLLERTVQGLLRELEQEEEEGTDHPIIPS